MKKSALTITAFLLALGVAAGASAQTRPSGAATTTRTDDSQRPGWTAEAGAIETGKLIGTKVQTADGNAVGSIDQLIVSQKDGKVSHVVISKGGVLGMGATKLVLKWSDVKLQRDPDHDSRLLALVDLAKIDAAPRYEAHREGDTAPAASPSTPPAPKASAPAKRH